MMQPAQGVAAGLLIRPCCTAAKALKLRMLHGASRTLLGPDVG